MITKFFKVIRDLFIVGGARIWLLYAVVLFVVIAPAASIRVANYSKLSSDLKNLTITKRQSQVDSIARSLSDRLQQLDAYTLALASHPQVRMDVAAGKWQEAIDLIAINRQFRSDPYDDRVFLANAQGLLQADTPELPGVRGQDFSYRPWYTVVIGQGQTYVSSAYRRVAAPQLNVISIAAPIMDTDNKIVGIVVTQVSLDHFADWMGQQNIGTDELAYIIDQEGQIITHPDNPAQGDIVTMAQSTEVRNVLGGLSGTVVIGDATPEQQLLSYAPVKKYGWGVMVEQPLASASAGQTDTLQKFLMLELLGSAWNFTILLMLLMTIHRLVQYLFSDDQQRRRNPSPTVAMVQPIQWSQEKPAVAPVIPIAKKRRSVRPAAGTVSTKRNPKRPIT